MNIINAFLLGWKTAVREKRLLLFLWAINAGFSLVFVLPVFFLLRHDFSHSLAASRLSRGLDLIWLGDLLYRYRDFTPILAGGIFSALLLWVPVSLGMTGGIFGALHQREAPFRWPDFTAAAGRYFFRFFRVFFLFCLAGVIIFLPFVRGLSSLFRLWIEKAASEWPAIWSGLLKILILLVLFSFLRMFFDYTRSLLVLEESRRVLRGVGRCASFLSPRLFSAWAVFLLASLVPAGLGIGYLAMARFFPTQSLTGFWLLFLIQQVYVFLRMGGKMLTLGSCYHFARLEKEKAQKEAERLSPPPAELETVS